MGTYCIFLYCNWTILPVSEAITKDVTQIVLARKNYGRDKADVSMNKLRIKVMTAKVPPT